MKKIVLSSLAALTLGSVAASATTVKLYTDETGAVFTKPAEGRTLLADHTPIYAKASKIKLSGDVYLGATYTDPEVGAKEAQFELRRAYLQIKSYFTEDSKSYYRVTMDAHNDNGSQDVRLKYAYIYLNNILPATGVEFGLAHRPWHDYEEHTAWNYRSINKVFTEDSNEAHLSNSADFGVNFKTKTKFFSSEIGLFNGEGYHNDQAGHGMSLEWRETIHFLGVNGKDKQTTKTYFDISFFGQYNSEYKGGDDLVFGGFHTVYNQPSFLLAAQYIKSIDTKRTQHLISANAGEGYSVNTAIRFGAKKEYRILARYDQWQPNAQEKQTTTIGGVAWEQSKNLEWVANVTQTTNDNDATAEKTSLMLTAEVKF